MTYLAHIATRIFDTPLLVRPETAAIIVDVLAERIGVSRETPEANAIEMSRFRGQPVRQNGDGATMYRVENGVAILPVMGELVNRGAWIGASSGLTSYEGLEASLRAAASDRMVSAIVLDMNSPGGEASGALETGELVRSINKQKPVVAFVNGQAASAAYAIASGAGKIVAAPSAVLGSIGVVLVHRDMSAAIEKQGVKMTVIHAGAYKADGNPFQALPDDARARIQGHVDAIYDLFTGMVAQHRGMDLADVRGTEAAIFLGADAVNAGLADSIGTLDSVLESLRRSNVSAGSPSHSGGIMTETTTAASAANAGFTQSHIDEAVATARAEERRAFAAALPVVFGDDARASTFAEALTDGVAVATAAKFASRAAAPRAGGVMALVPQPDIKPEAEARKPANDYEAGVAAFAAVVPSHLRAAK